MMRVRVGSAPGWSCASRITPSMPPWRQFDRDGGLSTLEGDADELELRIKGVNPAGEPRTTYYRLRRAADPTAAIAFEVGPFWVTGPLELVEKISHSQRAGLAWRQRRFAVAGLMQDHKG